MNNPTKIFVYGTLKRGHGNTSCWAAEPISVQAASVRGALYDLGPFPALKPGEGRVSGEVWEFESEQMPKVLEALDYLEGFHNSPRDLYRRVQVDATLEDGSVVSVWTYVFCHEVDESQRVHGNPAVWNGRTQKT